MRWDGRRWNTPAEFARRFGLRRRRRNPLLAGWRWRYELALCLGIPYGFHGLAAASNVAVAACTSLAAVLACALWPPGRRFVAARARVVLVQHRLRVGMLQADILSWSGWLPAILWTRPTSRGVRVLLWCPAGVDVTAFHDGRSLLAAACWAADVEVARHPTRAQLVVLLVVTDPAS